MVRSILKWLTRPSAALATGTLLCAGFIGGILFWGGLNWGMELTNTEEFCISCHEMRAYPYEELTHTIHYQNRTGNRATCPDCHVPKEWGPKVVRKIEASKELWYKLMGKLDSPEAYEKHRAEMAERVWERMRADDSLACRNCHINVLQMVENQKGVSRSEHARAKKEGLTCIDCHQGIAHKLPASLVAPEAIQEMYDF